MTPYKPYVKKLNDAYVFKILEQVMDEMIHVDAHAFDLGVQLLNYRDYLFKQLVTKYGLQQLANDYLDQIIKRLKEMQKENHN